MSGTFDESTFDDEDFRDKIRAGAASRKRPTDKQAARMGLRRIEAFVREELFKEPASSARDDQQGSLSAAERKQRQREKDDEKGWTQCNVKIPKDDIEIRETMRAVAAAAVQNAELYPRVAAVVRDECLQDLVGAAIEDRGLANLFEIVARREDLKRLLRSAIADVALASAMSDLSDAQDEVSSCMAAAIHEIRMSTAAGVPAELLSRASMGALSHPEPVATFVFVHEKGGLRARLLTWILRL